MYRGVSHAKFKQKSRKTSITGLKIQFLGGPEGIAVSFNDVGNTGRIPASHGYYYGYAVLLTGSKDQLVALTAPIQGDLQVPQLIST